MENFNDNNQNLIKNFGSDNLDHKVISKNQLKKIKKAEGLKELKQKLRQKAKEKRKEKQKKEKDEMKSKLNVLNQDERRKFFDEKKLRELAIEDNLVLGLKKGINIIFDLDYVNLMNHKEIKSVAHQISISYSLNKSVKNPFCYYLSGYKGLIKEELEKMGSLNWQVNFQENFFYEDANFKGKSLIYLSPDSDEVLDNINQDEILIIGGYIDKPISKFKSLQKADKYSIRTKRLPIKENYENKINCVLNINTVVEIISDYIENKDWGKALDKAIPKRKIRNL